MLDGVKYLGVILDSKLNWNQHLQKIINKAQTTFAVGCTCGKKWGLRPNMVHWLHTRVIRPSILHGALVWWPKAMQKNHKNPIRQDSKNGLSSHYGGYEIDSYRSNGDTPESDSIGFGNSGGGEDDTLYRLHILKQPAEPKAEAGLLSIWKYASDPLLEMWADHITPVYFHSKAFSVIIDWDHWKNKDPVFPEDALIWFTDGSKANSGTGSGIFGPRPNRSFSFPLGKFATVFQTEIYAILQCAYENIRRAYKNKQILIFSDSQGALTALSGPKVTSGMVAECLDALSALASLNKVTLVWVPGHFW